MTAARVIIVAVTTAAVVSATPARAQTTFAECRAALEVAGDAGLPAYSTCVQGVVASASAGFHDALDEVSAQRTRFEALPRSETDYYTLRAGDCDQERSVRAQLEGAIGSVSGALETLETTREHLRALDAEVTGMLATAALGGYARKAARHVQYLLTRSEVDLDRADRGLERGRELLTDMQRTTVENRCGTAEPLPEPTPPPAPDPSGRTEQPDGSVRFDHPTIDGVAVSACIYEPNCGGGRDAANAFCEAQGFSRAEDFAMSSHGDVPTRTVRGSDYPAGSAVLRWVVCHP